MIEGARKSGIWVRDIREKSGLGEAIIRRILKGLEQRKLIKSFKAVGTAKKSYILYDIDPDEQLIGGTFYSDGQFDSEFVQTLVQICVSMLQVSFWIALKNVLSFFDERIRYKISTF